MRYSKVQYSTVDQSCCGLFEISVVDAVYLLIGRIGANDFPVNDCTTCCLVNSFKFSIPVHFLTLLGIDPPHFAIKAAAKHTRIPHSTSVCIGVLTFCHLSTP